MTDFKAKMHQIRFRLGLRPRPRWGSLQRSPRPLAGFRGPTSKEREREGRGGDGRGGEGRKGKGKKGRGGEEREGEGRGRNGPWAPHYLEEIKFISTICVNRTSFRESRNVLPIPEVKIPEIIPEIKESIWNSLPDFVVIVHFITQSRNYQNVVFDYTAAFFAWIGVWSE